MYHIIIKVDEHWTLTKLAYGENIQEAINDMVDDINSQESDFDYSNFEIISIEKVS